jgi:hypothetical protein
LTDDQAFKTARNWTSTKPADSAPVGTGLLTGPLLGLKRGLNVDT